jgi:hypothetical protein
MRSEEEESAGLVSDGFLGAALTLGVTEVEGAASGAAKSNYFGNSALILLSSRIAESNAADSARDAGFSSVFNAGILIGNSSEDASSVLSSTFFGYSTALLSGSTISSFCFACTLCLSS